MTGNKIDGFRLGIYVFEDAEVVDFAAPYGVFSVARRYDPALDVFLVAETLRPVQAQAGFTVLPNYDLASRPAMSAFFPGRGGHPPGDLQHPAARVHTRPVARDPSSDPGSAASASKNGGRRT